MQKITWLTGQDLSYNHSMRRYWLALEDAKRTVDRYQPLTTENAKYKNSKNGLISRFQLQWRRHVAYPYEIRQTDLGSIAHILDHSWADLLHTIPRITRKVVTIHDLIPLRYAGELSPAQQKRFKNRVANLEKADALIAVSEFTKSETVELLKISPDIITVIPCGVQIPERDSTYTALELGSYRIGCFKIGSIGSNAKRKNLDILPEALAILKNSLSRPVALIRAGARLPKNLSDEIKRILGDQGLLELGNLRDEDVTRFYRSVDTVTIPSLYEGFGLPVLEAMAARVPVACSNSSSLPEVGGDSVWYFDPKNPEEMAARLFEIAEMPHNLRLDIAFKRANEFSWARCLDRIYQVYDRLLSLP